MKVHLAKIKKIALLLAGILVLALASVTSAAAESTLQTVLKRGKLLVGTTFDSPPTGSLDAQGNVIGYTPDLARYIAKRLGVELEFVQITASTRIPLLQTGRIDVEMAITTPQKQRNEVVDFTLAHMWDDGVLLVKPGSSLNPQDYKSTTKTIGSTQGNGFVENWRAEYPEAKFRLFREEPEVVVALKNGQVDGYLVNAFTGGRFAKSQGLAITEPWKRSENAFMVRQDDSKWRNWLNWTLQRMWTEKTIHKLYEKWYGIQPNFHMGDNGQIQQRIEIIGKTDDPWKDLPAGFMDTLLSDKSYTLK
jgi:polar amino acid transport system substrate-binding protein